MLARSLLYMQPSDGCREDLVAAFERLRIAETAMEQEGCLGVEMQTRDDPAAPVLVTALWADRAGYQGWLDNPRREETREEIFSLLTEEPEGIVYDIRVAAGNPVAASRSQA